MSDFIYYLRNALLPSMGYLKWVFIALLVAAWATAIHIITDVNSSESQLIIGAIIFNVTAFEAGVIFSFISVGYADWKKHINEETEIHDHI